LPKLDYARIDVNAIPAELRELPRWVCWRAEEGKGKPPKNPHDPALRLNAKCNDPATWSSFDYAHGALNRLPLSVEAGLSFALNGDGIVGIDLDDCRNPKTRSIDPWAVKIIERFSSYTEISPSGSGIRIFFRGNLPPQGRHKGNIEVYATGKFLSVTGHTLTTYGATAAVEDRGDELLAWHRETFGPSSTSTKKSSDGPQLILNDPPVIDEDRLSRLFSSKPKARCIYEGDRNGYASQSEADLALANYAVRGGLTDQETCDLLVAARINAGEDRAKAVGYFVTTIAKAREGANSFNGLIPSTASPPAGPEGGNSVNDLILSIEPALGEAAYHGFIGDFLRLVGPLTEATDACVLAHLIPAIGTVIGPDLYAWGGDQQPPRFNTAVVGPTATGRKGTGAVPVRGLMKLAAPDLWEGLPVKGLSSGEGLIVKVADKVIGHKDCSEGIIPVEKRLYVLEPEFSKVLANIGRENNVLSQIMREAYDSGDLATLTVNPREASGAHVSITGHITPEELKKRLSKIEMANGFANRFLWFFVRSDKRMPNAEPIPAKDMAAFAGRLRKVFLHAEQLTQRQMVIPGGERFHAIEETRVGMDPETAEVWKAEYDKLCLDRPGFVGALTARGSSQVLRLSLLYALLDLGSGKADPKTLIRLPHLKAALAVWDYSVASVELLFRTNSGDSLADKLYALLGGGPMLTSEFYKHVASKGDDIHEALEQLERNELIVREKLKTGKRGQPATRWRRADSLE
jgi:hypothetical protein